MFANINEYLDSCKQINRAPSSAIIRIIARQSHEDTSEYDAMTCCDESCTNH